MPIRRAQLFFALLRECKACGERLIRKWHLRNGGRDERESDSSFYRREFCNKTCRGRYIGKVSGHLGGLKNGQIRYQKLLERLDTLPEKQCKQCHKTLTPKRYKNGQLEDYYGFSIRQFCDDACKGLYSLTHLPKPQRILWPILGYEEWDADTRTIPTAWNTTGSTDAKQNYKADFAHKKVKLVVEIDGPEHYTTKGRQKDAIRTKQWNRHGYTVIRFTNKETLANPAKVARKIGRVLLYLFDNPHLEGTQEFLDNFFQKDPISA